MSNLAGYQYRQKVERPISVRFNFGLTRLR